MTAINRAVAMALFATVAWGGVFPVLKAMLQTLDPFWLTAIRFAIAATALLLLLVVLEGPGAFRAPRLGYLAILGIVGFGVFNFLLCVGLTHSTPERGAVIMATTPILGALLEAARTRSPIALPQLCTIVVAFIGIVLVVTQGDVARLRSGGVGWGEAAILLGALSWAIYTTFGRGHNLSPLRFTAITATLGTVAIVAFTLMGTAAGWMRAPAPALLWANAPGMLYVALLGTFLAALAWNGAVALQGAPRTIVFMNVVPITAFVIGIVRGGHFPVMEYVGAAVTIGALIAYNKISTRTQSGAVQHGSVQVA